MHGNYSIYSVLGVMQGLYHQRYDAFGFGYGSRPGIPMGCYTLRLKVQGFGFRV